MLSNILMGLLALESLVLIGSILMQSGNSDGLFKYLSANYMEKVSLSEIAEKEFLNPSSHCY